jgi:arylsulfatase A-like enzyme
MMTSIALVVLDTLRKDAFDEYFDWHPGTHFENAWSTSAWTVPAHASLFGGLYPSELGVYAKHEHLNCNRNVLAERLSNQGYTTRAFSANAFVSESFSYDRGFDEFHTNWRGRMNNPDVVDWGMFISKTQGQGPSRFLRALYRCLASDKNTRQSLKLGIKMKAEDLGIESIAGSDDGAGEVLTLLRKNSFTDREFLFINLMEAHSPYNPPKQYQTVSVSDYPNLSASMADDSQGFDESSTRQAYDDAVRYLADIYEDIFNELADNFDYIFTLGDHGELFGTDGAWGHNHGIYPELVNVPLVMYDGTDRTEHRRETVGLLDVHRTILDLAGLGDVDSRGKNLMEETSPNAQLVERFGLRDSHIESQKQRGVSADQIDRYDQALHGIALPSDYYGYETLDGFEERGGATVEDPQQRLSDLRDSLDIVEPSTDEKEVSETIQRRLKNLGYA